MHRRHSAPAMLYQELSLAQRVLRDIATGETSSVLVDSPDALADLATELTERLGRIDAGGQSIVRLEATVTATRLSDSEEATLLIEVVDADESGFTIQLGAPEPK